MPLLSFAVSQSCHTNSLASVWQAETRAEFAERSVAKLEKTIDDLEGTFWGWEAKEYVVRSGELRKAVSQVAGEWRCCSAPQYLEHDLTWLLR